MNVVSKVLLTCGEIYVFSIKKSPLKPEKHNKLELFGGNVEPGESPFEGLIRELREEEESGTLAEKAVLLKPDIIKQFVVDDKTQCIFQMDLTPDEYHLLKTHPAESLGIRTICRALFTSSDLLNLNQFTPKTVAIFKNLQLI